MHIAVPTVYTTYLLLLEWMEVVDDEIDRYIVDTSGRVVGETFGTVDVAGKTSGKIVEVIGTLHEDTCRAADDIGVSVAGSTADIGGNIVAGFVTILVSLLIILVTFLVWLALL